MHAIIGFITFYDIYLADLYVYRNDIHIWLRWTCSLVQPYLEIKGIPFMLILILHFSFLIVALLY